MDDQQTISRIKSIIYKLDKSAKAYLYGSRARGTMREESDWDVLILVDKPTVSIKDEQFFRHKLFELELEIGEAISTMVYSRKDWDNNLLNSPIHQAVESEGLAILS